MPTHTAPELHHFHCVLYIRRMGQSHYLIIMSATISNCTRPLGEATEDGIYLHTLISFLCVWILYVLYDWRVFQKRLASSTTEILKTQALAANALVLASETAEILKTQAVEIQERQALLDANALVLASNAAEIQKIQAALDANEEDVIPEVQASEKKTPAAQKPFESDPIMSKSMAEEAQVRRAKMAAKKAMVPEVLVLVPYTCCALWVDQQA
jgi:hypothetical protein